MASAFQSDSEWRREQKIQREANQMRLDEEMEETFGEEELLSDEPEDNVYDHTFRWNETRPTWHPGTYQGLFGAQRNRGQLWCGICNLQIDLTHPSSRGLEVYDPSLGYHNQTKPHIDHYNYDWVDRKRIIDGKHLSEEERRIALYEAFNGPHLRIVHKHCNLRKAAGT